MPFKDPHFRVYDALEVLEGQRKRKSVDERTNELLDVMGDSSTDLDLIYAWDKYQQSSARLFLDSFLLCDTPPEVIRQATGINLGGLRAYATHIFDNTVFRDQLDKLQYVHDVSQYQTPQEAVYLRAALTGGAPYLAWLISGRKATLAKEVIQTLMTEAYFRCQVFRGVPLDSPIAKEARVLADAAARYAVMLEKLDPQESSDLMNQLTITLTHRDETINAETPGAPKPGQILHGNN
jgi:hypothetical protein